MKKTVIILVIALSFSIATLNAKPVIEHDINYKTELVIEVNPFCTSIAKGDLVTVKKLIALGADVNEKSNGMSPAMYAAKFNRVEILKYLISKGANLKARSSKGMTALKYAEASKAVDTEALIHEVLSRPNK